MVKGKVRYIKGAFYHQDTFSFQTVDKVLSPQIYYLKNTALIRKILIFECFA